MLQKSNYEKMLLLCYSMILLINEQNAFKTKCSLTRAFCQLTAVFCTGSPGSKQAIFKRKLLDSGCYPYTTRKTETSEHLRVSKCRSWTIICKVVAF